jgi:hypothetical protein
MDHTQHDAPSPDGDGTNPPDRSLTEQDARLAELAAVDAADAPEPAERLAADLSNELDVERPASPETEEHP